MATLINNAGVQHYANKMVLAENRKVGSKSLPTALTDIDNLIDEMKTQFDVEYGSALDMKLENNENVFSVGTGTNVDKRSEVENSFTDVELSGNSLVNLCPQKYKFVTVTTKGEATLDGLDVTYDSPTYRIKAFTLTQSLKPNTTYTAIVNVLSLINTNTIDSYVKYSDGETLYGQFSATQLGLNIKKFTTTNKIATELAYYLNSGERSAKISGVIILEGDWTNKPIPQYFQGLKSVGEKEDGNHKISISSMGKNLCPVTEYTIYNVPINQNMNGYRDTIIARNIRVKPNTTYAIYFKDVIGAPSHINLKVMTFRDRIAETGLTHVDCYNHPNRIREYAISRNKFNATITTENDANYINVTTGGFSAESSTITYVDLQIVEGSTVDSIDSYKEDKKEISLNEPLRGLPNGVKDTIEKINGEWKIVRRCSEVVLNGSEPWALLSDTDKEKTIGFSILNFLPLSRYGDKYKMVVCDRFPSYKHNLWKKDYEGITTENNINDIINDTQLQIIISKSELSTKNIAGFKQWLSQNPTKVIYQLDTPIIEDISPITLQCWKNGTISIDEVLPVETTHTVALNKPAQIKRNIEELTVLRKRVQALEEQYDQVALEQAHQLSLLNHSIELDYDI